MQSKHLLTLDLMIKNRQMTSPELSKATKVGYPPRKIQILEEKGVRFIHDLVPYITREGRKTMVARYTILTPIKEAKRIYKSLVK